PATRPDRSPAASNAPVIVTVPGRRATPCCRSHHASATCCALAAGATTSPRPSCAALVTPRPATSSAPPDATPATILTPSPPPACHTATAAIGSRYAASSWLRCSARASAIASGNGTACTLTPPPKYPSRNPASAGTSASVAVYPSRSTTSGTGGGFGRAGDEQPAASTPAAMASTHARFNTGLSSTNSTPRQAMYRTAAKSQRQSTNT